jgi:toxin YoeB
MRIVYTSQAQDDRVYWEKTNLKIIKRIDQLITDIQLHPFSGIGKPEPLKFEKMGYWSRRINKEHRLVYKIANETIYIAQCRYHY